VGCLGCHQAPPSNYDDSWRNESSLISDEEKESRDSVDEKDLNDAAEETSKGKLYLTSGYSSYSSESDDKEYDNIRGFDPASEDDMEDNGMARYMENNDEEGWD
jgi:hypothetical protein